MSDKLKIDRTSYELIDYKPSTEYALKIGDKYAVLTKHKPLINDFHFKGKDYGLKFTNGSTVLYLNRPIKPLSKIKMKRAVWGDDQKGHWHSFIKFYNKNDQLICQFVNLPNDWWEMEAEIDQTVSDQSIAKCHAYYYQDTHSGGRVAWTCDVIDIDGVSHRLFYGEGFKNHGKGDNVWLGLNGTHNWFISQNNFPMELKY